MSWGEIGKALNSTVQTADMKPLDDMILNQGHASLTGEGKTIYSAENIATRDYTCIAKFIAPVSGMYKVTAEYYSQYSFDFYVVKDICISSYSYNKHSTYITTVSASNSYSLSTIGTDSIVKGSSIWSTYPYSDSEFKYSDLLQFVARMKPPSSFYIYANAGEPIQIIGTAGRYSTIDKLTITYQER